MLGDKAKGIASAGDVTIEAYTKSVVAAIISCREYGDTVAQIARDLHIDPEYIDGVLDGARYGVMQNPEAGF